MRRKLYSPQLADDVVRQLYRAAKARRVPMTVLASMLIRTALAVTDYVTVAEEPVGPGDPRDRKETADL